MVLTLLVIDYVTFTNRLLFHFVVMKPEMRHMFMIQEKIYLLHFFLFKSSIKSLLLLRITIVFKGLL